LVLHRSVRLESIVLEGSGWLLTLCRGGILQSVRCEFVIDASGRAASIGKRVGLERRWLRSEFWLRRFD
jgi:flavin-dependent dehydrogenase